MKNKMIESVTGFGGRNFLIFMIFLGVSTGLTAAYFVTAEERECRSMEDDLREGQNFDGTVTCHPPGSIDVDLSEHVEEGGDLQCVCRMTMHDSTRLFPILTG